MTLRALFAATSIACLLAACGGDESTPTPPVPPVTAPVAQPLALTILHINDPDRHPVLQPRRRHRRA